MKKSVQFLCLLLWGKVAESRMRGYSKFPKFLIFSVQINPSPTTNVVPPLSKWARVFSDKKIHLKKLVCQNYDMNYLKFI